MRSGPSIDLAQANLIGKQTCCKSTCNIRQGLLPYQGLPLRWGPPNGELRLKNQQPPQRHPARGRALHI